MARAPVPASVWRNPVHWLAFGAGAGAVPWAPGTFGTLVAVPLYLWLQHLAPGIYALVVAGLFAAGVWLCDRTERDIGIHDHSGIVWDEIVGYLITMFLAPAGWLWLVTGFLLFRLFDIWKPFPIRWLNDHLRGGWGIMADDAAAGVAAALSLQGMAWTYANIT